MKLIYRILATLTIATLTTTATAKNKQSDKSLVAEYNVFYSKDKEDKTLNDSSFREVLSELSKHYKFKILEYSKYNPSMAIIAANSNTATKITKHPKIKSVEANSNIQLNTRQDNPTWGLDRIDQPGNVLNNKYIYPENGGESVHVYVVDTGINSNHVGFSGRLGNGVNTYSPITSSDGSAFDIDSTEDCHGNSGGHGTHVAGIIGSEKWGVAKKVILHSVKVAGCGGRGSIFGLIEGLSWIRDNVQMPAVVNMSLSTSLTSIALEDIVNELLSNGITVVASAGNNKADACLYTPAKMSGVITVGATNSDDIIWNDTEEGSNWGSCVDVYAPGVDIESANLSFAGSRLETGTSMAAPHVSGIAALYLSENPSATPSQVKSAILTNAIYDSVVSGEYFVQQFLGGIDDIGPTLNYTYSEFAGCSGTNPMYLLNWQAPNTSSYRVEKMAGDETTWSEIYEGGNTGFMYYGLNNSTNKIRIHATDSRGVEGLPSEMTLVTKNCSGSGFPPPIL